MKPDDRTRLLHMLDAAREAMRFASGRDQSDLAADRMLALALVKLIEIIGEAAARVSEDTRAQHPNIPWPAIVAMRNRLVHGYYDIDTDRVWDTVVDDLPPLVDSLAAILR